MGWSKRKLFECPDCYKTFENKKAMDMHRESIHLGIRTVCPLCDKPVTRLGRFFRIRIVLRNPERKKFRIRSDLL